LPGIGDDLLNLGDGEVAFGILDLAWFQIDDPIAFALLGAAQILLWKLILLGRDVVIDRI